MARIDILHLNIKYQEKFALYSSKLSDVIDSVREIKLFDLYKKETDEVDSKTEDLVLINVKRIFWGFTSGQFGVSLQHIIIGILLGFLGCQVQQKVVTLGQAIFIYRISDNLFMLLMIFGVFIFLLRIPMRLGKELKEYCLENVKIMMLKKLTV